MERPFPIVRVLLEAGADPNKPVVADRSARALLYAIFNGRLNVVYMLLEAGANPQNCWRENAVTLARRRGHIAIAEMMEHWLRERSAQENSE
jgi:ankyrin repeat protein